MTINATAAALLGLLHDGPSSGYALHQRAVAEIGDFWSVTRSQVYRELATMAAGGLVTAQQAGARDARPHVLTSAGRAAFAAWLAADCGPDVVRIPLLLRLAFAGRLDPRRLADIVAEQRAEHVARLAGYEQTQGELQAAGVDVTSIELATLRFGLAYERAVLEWFDALELPSP